MELVFATNAEVAASYHRYAAIVEHKIPIIFILLLIENLYLTSDGFADQNNPEREKLGSPKLYETIQYSASLPPDQQKKKFELVLDEHQQDAEQRDDITIIGVKV